MTTSDILWQAYQKYFLIMGGKQVPTPYRLNHPYQPDPKKYGKSNPEQLTNDVITEAAGQDFDLETASVEEIREFMKRNKFGVDCSGYVYWCLNSLLKNRLIGEMTAIGFPKASKTNVKLLSSEEFSVPIESIDEIQPGDFITFKTGPGGHSHILLIMEKQPDRIIYTQSSGLGTTTGVQQNSITIINSQKNLKDQDWDERLNNGEKRVDYFLPELGDGVRRLKVLA